MQHFDTLIIGGGPAGLMAAIRASSLLLRKMTNSAKNYYLLGEAAVISLTQNLTLIILLLNTAIKANFCTQLLANSALIRLWHFLQITALKLSKNAAKESSQLREAVKGFSTLL